MSVSLQTKRVLAYYGRLIAVLLVVIGILSFAGAAYVYTNPPTRQVTQQTNVQQVSTSVETSAVVTGNTTLYSEGQRLVDQSVYLMAATPNLTLQVRTTGPSQRRVEISQGLTLRLSAAREGRTFWESRRPWLSTDRTTRDGQVTSSTTVNMSKVAAFIDEREGLVGGIGDFAVQVRLNVTYDTGLYSGGLTAEAPLTLSDRAYWIDGDLSDSASHSQTETRRVEEPPDRVTYLSLGVFGVVALLGAGVIAYLRREEIDIEQLETDLDVARFDEWISEGEFPTDPEKKYVPIASLEDLVDIAIDSEKRVIHDPEYGVYAVMDGDLIYYFTPGQEQLDLWFNM